MKVARVLLAGMEVFREQFGEIGEDQKTGTTAWPVPLAVAFLIVASKGRVAYREFQETINATSYSWPKGARRRASQG